ncbi:hypothetical protein Esti_000128 [Eimeria stiedai]
MLKERDKRLEEGGAEHPMYGLMLSSNTRGKTCCRLHSKRALHAKNKKGAHLYLPSTGRLKKRAVRHWKQNCTNGGGHSAKEQQPHLFTGSNTPSRALLLLLLDGLPAATVALVFRFACVLNPPYTTRWLQQWCNERRTLAAPQQQQQLERALAPTFLQQQQQQQQRKLQKLVSTQVAKQLASLVVAAAAAAAATAAAADTPAAPHLSGFGRQQQRRQQHQQQKDLEQDHQLQGPQQEQQQQDKLQHPSGAAAAAAGRASTKESLSPGLPDSLALSILRRRDSAAAAADTPPFSSSSSSSSAFEDAIKGSREAIATLDKRHAHILRRAQAQSEAARASVTASDRSGAMLALQRRRLLLQDLQQLAAARLTLEKQLLQLEAAQTQQVAVSAMTAAVQAHKELNKQLNSCNVERLLESLTEQQEAQQDLAEALQQNATPVEEEASSEMDLLRELDELEAFEVEKQLLDPPAATKKRQQMQLLTQPESELLRLQQQLQLQQQQQQPLQEPFSCPLSEWHRETNGLQQQQQRHGDVSARPTAALLEQLQQQQQPQQLHQHKQQQHYPHRLRQHAQQHRLDASPSLCEGLPLPVPSHQSTGVYSQLLLHHQPDVQQQQQQHNEEARLGVLLYS